MRELTSHKVGGLDEVLRIEVLDSPENGNAVCHEYRVIPEVGNAVGVCISFQKGPLGNKPPNGLSVESLLAICEDRLLGFQTGDFPCRENALALTKVQEAMHWLQKRTRDRIARGVEGQYVK